MCPLTTPNQSADTIIAQHTQTHPPPIRPIATHDDAWGGRVRKGRVAAAILRRPHLGAVHLRQHLLRIVPVLVFTCSRKRTAGGARAAQVMTPAGAARGARGDPPQPGHQTTLRPIPPPKLTQHRGRPSRADPGQHIYPGVETCSAGGAGCHQRAPMDDRYRLARTGLGTHRVARLQPR